MNIPRFISKSRYLTIKPRYLSSSVVTPFHYQKLFDLSEDKTTVFRKLSGDHVSSITLGNQKFLKVEPEAIELLSYHAMSDISHLLRPAHLQQLSNILKDPEATANDKFVALELLKNANIAANYVLPGCQGNHITN
jgi:fumarate hydratase, class I